MSLVFLWRLQGVAMGVEMMGLMDEVRELHEEFIRIRHDIHAHPELAFEETRTAALIARLLADYGLEVHTGVGKTGVVGVLRGHGGAGDGGRGRAIGIRADIDALPMPEKTGLPYASTREGCMHGCGHDGHTATLLYAAKFLAQHRDFDGTVNFIFQPAEELPPGGALAMMDDGLFERFPCDEIYGLHNRPGLAVGQLGFPKGAAAASSSSFDIVIKGVGGHAAVPQKTVDPVVMAGEMIGALQTVISRHRNPDATAVLSITQVHAGDAYNVIPDEAVLRGTVRTFDMATLDGIEDDMRRVVQTLPQMHGGRGELYFVRGYPVLDNWEAQREFAIGVAQELLGADNVHTDFPRRSGSEDFAYYLQRVPGCFFHLGGAKVGKDALPVCEVHNPHYDFNDDSMPVGAAFWVALVRAFCRRP